jgi:hypothetical protein
MIDQHNLSELEEMILLGLREQAIHPQGLNSSQTHGTLYPVGDPRNDKKLHQEQPKLHSHKLMRPRAGWR